MQRQILIIDDHDDLASGLKKKFETGGHQIETIKTRAEAVDLDSLEGYDLVVIDLDNSALAAEISEKADKAESSECLPEMPAQLSNTIKAFKICASGFRRESFDENELKELVQTVLDYKLEFVDKAKTIKNIQEKIEFEIPSAIALMDSILDYLMKRVAKVGVINPENSNLFIALDEAFVNAVKHGNKYDAAKLVRITATVSNEEARFTVEDEGEGFDVNAIPDPRDPENLFKTSGRGVLIIHNVMDEVKYNERGNRVEMIKRSR